MEDAALPLVVGVAGLERGMFVDAVSARELVWLETAPVELEMGPVELARCLETPMPMPTPTVAMTTRTRTTAKTHMDFALNTQYVRHRGAVWLNFSDSSIFSSSRDNIGAGPGSTSRPAGFRSAISGASSEGSISARLC